jgi:hypothetical protein
MQSQMLNHFRSVLCAYFIASDQNTSLADEVTVYIVKDVNVAAFGSESSVCHLKKSSR